MAGPTFTSNPIPTTNVVAGRFGDGLTLTGFNTAGAGGGQFLMFPEAHRDHVEQWSAQLHRVDVDQDDEHQL
jgi:hypothetical protein